MLNSIEPVIDWIQTPQISFYTPGEQYNWHDDGWPSWRTHIRHFTLTCELKSAPGAAFEMKDRTITPLTKGQAVIFPSTDTHRATSPTDGERISFTIWAMTKNKEPDLFIKQFKGVFKKVVTMPIENEFNSVSSNELYKIAVKNKFKVEKSNNFFEALKKISSKEEKIIVCFGSLYNCGNILNKN